MLFRLIDTIFLLSSHSIVKNGVLSMYRKFSLSFHLFYFVCAMFLWINAADKIFDALLIMFFLCLPTALTFYLANRWKSKRTDLNIGLIVFLSTLFGFMFVAMGLAAMPDPLAPMMAFVAPVQQLMALVFIIAVDWVLRRVARAYSS